MMKPLYTLLVLRDAKCTIADVICVGLILRPNSWAISSDLQAERTSAQIKRELDNRDVGDYETLCCWCNSLFEVAEEVEAPTTQAERLDV